MWIDALCINQEDLEEKTEQAPKMWDVYASATRLVAWLGPAGHDGQAAIEAIQDIGIKIKVIEEDEMRYMGSSELKCLGFDMNQINWPYIWTFLNRPCWRRIWVVQKLASYNAHEGLSENSDMSIIMCVLRYMLKVELERFVKLLILLSFHKGNKFDVNYGCSMMEPLQFFVTFGHTSAEHLREAPTCPPHSKRSPWKILREKLKQ